MPVSCAAFGCKSRYNLETRDKGITFHRFPKSNPSLLDKWRLAMKRATSTGELWMPSRYQRLCSLHFQETCFDTTGQTKRLRDDMIPSIFNFEQHPKPKQTTRRTALKTWTSESGNVLSEGPAVEQTASDTCAGVNQDHIYSMPDSDTLKRKLHDLVEGRPQKKQELETRNHQEEPTRPTWRSVFQELRQMRLMTRERNESLLASEGVPLELFRRPESEYSTEQRLFALTLHLYEPKSYQYLRQELKLPLPGPKQLRGWLKSEDPGPGINIAFLKALLEKNKGRPAALHYVCLSMGTMAIRQHVSYDERKKTLVGFSSFGRGAEAYRLHDLASEVMVLMLTDIAGDWNFPVAYFLTKPLTAEATTQLILHTLGDLCDFGLEVVALTMDGQYINEQVCTLLGCNFTDLRQLKPCFSIPGRKQKCYVIFDAEHELKLMCSSLKTAGAIQSPLGTITWEYIDELQNLHKDSKWCASRKRTKRHSELFSQVIRGALSVRMLSKSTAATLQAMNELKHRRFADCMATVQLIQVVNRLHDILTSTSRLAKGDRRRIDASNLQYKLNLLQETKEYLLSLTTVENKPLYESSRKRCIVGFLVTISSLLLLLPRLILVQEHVVLQRFSQDPLRLLFYCVQKAGGRNNTPTAFNIKHVISLLLLRCRLNDGTLERVLCKDGVSCACTFEDDNVPICFQQNLPPPFEDRSIALPDHPCSSRLQHAVPYIAGWVLQNALGRISCDACRNCLVTEDMPKDFTSAYHLLQLKANGGLFVPSEGTIKTVVTAEQCLQRMPKVHRPQYLASQLLLEHQVLSEIGNTDIFNLKEHILDTACGIDNHHYQLLRLITAIYYVLRQPYFSTLEQLEAYKRHVHQTLMKSSLKSY